ncbi:uncharacterized protein G2W53_002636 [Senna tora]|uniref:Uncharacterized protein n=1 Tax=Senna tora TaxID=362788 RepID=A0A834X7L8_9FABA|nr:uncharacterized protein G2W53_002636 [Senna tora]
MSRKREEGEDREKREGHVGLLRFWKLVEADGGVVPASTSTDGGTHRTSPPLSHRSSLCVCRQDLGGELWNEYICILRECVCDHNEKEKKGKKLGEIKKGGEGAKRTDGERRESHGRNEWRW